MGLKRLPLVTGISPKEGPPGTKVTIRGENLGVDARDLIGLKICGVDCHLAAEWKSSSKIIARTGLGKGKGDVIVMTRSGGVGSCTVGFRGFFVQTGPLQESAVWVDETARYAMVDGRHRPQSPILKEHDNPLGISDEGSESKFPEEELQELFPGGCGATTADNFVPAWFLLENHHGTGFDDLKAGLAYLKRKASQSNEGPREFVKTNLSAFIACLDTLSAMHEKLVEDQKQLVGGANMTESLGRALAEGNDCADNLFKDVLGRKDKADATRNALQVLQRFKFFFSLPCAIDRNIKTGDYDLVISDYARAKTLYGKTDVNVFKKVDAEVEERIQNFRRFIHAKLMELPTPLEEQKKLIRYLISLEMVGDPAWECISNQQKWLLDLLLRCKDEHIEKDRSASKELQLMSPKKKKSSPIKTKGKTGSLTRVPQQVHFIEDLCKILTDTFPDLWRLGQAYLSGKLVKPGTMAKGPKVDPVKHQQFKKMILDVTQTLSNLVRAAFLPTNLPEDLTLDERHKFGIWPERHTPGAWLPQCVRCVRSCVNSLLTLELPSDSIESLHELALDMRSNCMNVLLNQAIEDIDGLNSCETWAVATNDENGGVTQLPLLFENIVNETVQHLHEVVLQTKDGEAEIFEQRPIQKEATLMCSNIMQAFSRVLHHLAMKGNLDASLPNRAKQKQQRRSIISKMSHMDDSTQDDPVPNKDKRLIIVLSNCSHTINVMIPRLVENLEKHGYPETETVQQDAEETYGRLDKVLFDAYVEEKSNAIIGHLEQNMYAGKFDWNDSQRPSGVRSYVKEAVMGLIGIHSEVFAISPHLVTRVLHTVCEHVVEEVSRLIQCVTGFNSYGALQARVDLSAIENAIGIYKTSQIRTSIKEAIGCLPPMDEGAGKKLMEDCQNRFQSQMKFHLLCFKSDPVKKRSSSPTL